MHDDDFGLMGLFLMGLFIAIILTAIITLAVTAHASKLVWQKTAIKVGVAKWESNKEGAPVFTWITNSVPTKNQ